QGSTLTICTSLGARQSERRTIPHGTLCATNCARRRINPPSHEPQRSRHHPLPGPMAGVDTMTHEKTPAAQSDEPTTGEVERLSGHQLRRAEDDVVRHPRLSTLERAMASLHTRSLELTVLCVLAVLYTLYLAREVVVPIVFAVLLKLFFGPTMRALRKAHIPDPVGAALVILVLLSIFGIGGYAISGQAQQWFEKAPRTIAAATAKFKKL